MIKKKIIKKLIFISCLFLTTNCYGAISSTTQWEVRTTGNANNGGGFCASPYAFIRPRCPDCNTFPCRCSKIESEKNKQDELDKILKNMLLEIGIDKQLILYCATHLDAIKEAKSQILSWQKKQMLSVEEIEKEIEFIYDIFWHKGEWKNNGFVIKESFKVYKEQLARAIYQSQERGKT